MHAVGLHSALAIRRERKRRAEQQRARERRYSLQSSESGVTSPHCSSGSLERARRPPRSLPPAQDNDIVSSVGMLHLGVVFLVLGLFLVGSGWLPDDVTAWSSVGSASWFNELVCSGLFALGIGIFLVALHKYLTKSEEDALEEYVQRQLTRSRSGHRLERDAETGGMSTRHARRARATEVGLPAHPPPPHPLEGELCGVAAHGFLNALDSHALDLIAEEDCGGAGTGYAPVAPAAQREPAIQDDRRDASSGGAARAAARGQARRRGAQAQPAAAAARAPRRGRHALAPAPPPAGRPLRLRQGGAATRHRGRRAARHRGAGGGAGAALAGRRGRAAPLLPDGRRRRTHRRRAHRRRAQVHLSALVQPQVWRRPRGTGGCGRCGGRYGGRRDARAQVPRRRPRARAGPAGQAQAQAEGAGERHGAPPGPRARARLDASRVLTQSPAGRRTRRTSPRGRRLLVARPECGHAMLSMYRCHWKVFAFNIFICFRNKLNSFQVNSRASFHRDVSTFSFSSGATTTY